MASLLTAAPVLSTPAEHIFEYAQVQAEPAVGPARTDDELRVVYEVARTAGEIRAGGWCRVALQFPDSMLPDAPRIAQILGEELAKKGEKEEEKGSAEGGEGEGEGMAEHGNRTGQQENGLKNGSAAQISLPLPSQPPKVYILADTSYSACCVDEIAAEHAGADVAVHYGRACLSPTSRLPVVHVFTRHELDHSAVVAAFEREFPLADQESAKVVIMADVTYQDHVPALFSALVALGYSGLLSTDIVHDPLGRIPNRKILDAKGHEVLASPDEDPSNGNASSDAAAVHLREYSVFHVSTPPTALLLALSSRVKSLHVFATDPSSSSTSSPSQRARSLLGRRYARVLALASAGVVGILINTLSVANYLSSVDRIRRRIAAAGKKSYTVVVGKLNPAKLANFAEIDGWVVVGCWESSLVEDDGSYFKPVVTPFELEAALMGDDRRVWGGDWWGGIEAVGAVDGPDGGGEEATMRSAREEEGGDRQGGEEVEGGVDGDESEPPEFDLRTGRLVYNSRPMRARAGGLKGAGGNAGAEPAEASSTNSIGNGALALRPKNGELATINGVFSPGAEFLRSQRTWQGLGSDFESTERSAPMEEGRSGLARGYTVGEDGGERR